MSVAELNAACPVCRRAIGDEAACDDCSWTLSGGWVLGPVTPQMEAEFEQRLTTAQRRFDLAAAVRAAGFPDAGDALRLRVLEGHVRGGPPPLAERDAAIAAAAAVPAPEAPASARELAERAEVPAVLVVEAGADGLAAARFEATAGTGLVRTAEAAWPWTELVDGLADDGDERQLQLAGTHVLVPRTPVLEPDGALVLLVCRVPGWPLPERALELLAAQVPGARRLWQRPAADAPPEPLVIRTPAPINAFAAAGGLAVAGDTDGNVTLWAPPRREPVAQRRLHDRRVTALAVALDPSGEPVVVSGGMDGAVRRWATAIQHDKVLATHDTWVNAARIVGEEAFSLGDDQRVRRAGGTAAPAFPLDVGWEASSALAVTHDGGRLAVGGENGRVAAYDASSGDLLGSQAVRVRVYSLELDPGGERLAVGCGDGRVLLLGFPGLQRAGELRVSDCPIRALAMDGDGVVLAGDDRGRVWRARSGMAVECVAEHGGPVRGIGLGDGGVAISGGGDSMILITGGGPA